MRNLTKFIPGKLYRVTTDYTQFAGHMGDDWTKGYGPVVTVTAGSIVIFLEKRNSTKPWPVPVTYMSFLWEDLVVWDRWYKNGEANLNSFLDGPVLSS